ncbi:MAG: hypothetical protein GY774_38860 [Planctomycetes bacterium]|nr:hypothetical protein [Planctomycetota bacterium]
MRPNSLGDLKFQEFYSQSKNAPRWLAVTMNVFFTFLKVAILYGVAKLVSIEAALLVYVVVIGILQGFDDYAEHRNMNMLVWNDQQLNERISSLESSLKK